MIEIRGQHARRAKFVYYKCEERAVRVKRARWPPEVQVELWCKANMFDAM